MVVYKLKDLAITMIAIQISEGSTGNPQVSRKLPPQFSEIKPTVQNNLILVTIAMKLRRKIVNWSQSRQMRGPVIFHMYLSLF